MDPVITSILATINLLFGVCLKIAEAVKGYQVSMQRVKLLAERLSRFHGLIDEHGTLLVAKCGKNLEDLSKYLESIQDFLEDFNKKRFKNFACAQGRLQDIETFSSELDSQLNEIHLRLTLSKLVSDDEKVDDKVKACGYLLEQLNIQSGILRSLPADSHAQSALVEAVKQDLAWATIHLTYCKSDGRNNMPENCAIDVLTPDLFDPPIPDLVKQTGKLLGEGSFGKVFRGKFDGRDAAIKQLKLAKLGHASLNEISKEHALVKALGNHENVLQSIGVVALDDMFCIVTELADGGSLADRFTHANKSRTPLSVVLRLRWAEDIAKGMDALHSHEPPIIHRDLKPNNILIHKNRALIADFGCAKAKEEVMTVTNPDFQFAGTPAWAPPEAIRDKMHGRSGDVYSYSMLLYYLGSTKTPWHGTASGLISAKVVEGKRPNVRDVAKEAPDWYFQLMLDCWSAEPGDRPLFPAILDVFVQEAASSSA